MVMRTSSGFKLPKRILQAGCLRSSRSDLASSPGDYLKPGEDELEGLKRRLDDRLAPPSDSRQFNASHGIDNDWEIGDCLAQWWHPDFETFMVRDVRFLHQSDVERGCPTHGHLVSICTYAHHQT